MFYLLKAGGTSTFFLQDFLCENFIISKFTISLSHSLSVFKNSFIYELLNQCCSYVLFFFGTRILDLLDGSEQAITKNQ